MADQKTPIYYRPVVIVLALIFLAPLGVFLMWKGPHWSRGVKIVVTAASLLFFARAMTLPKPERTVQAPTVPPATPTKLAGTPATIPEAGSPSPALAVPTPKATSSDLSKSGGSNIVVQSSTQKLDLLAGTFAVEALAENSGDVPARLDGCTFRLEGGEGCDYIEDANVQVQASYKVGKETRKERTALLVPELYQRLARDRILVPGGSANLWAKVPLRKLKECNPKLIEVRVHCLGNDVESVEGWPPTSPAFIKGKAAK